MKEKQKKRLHALQESIDEYAQGDRSFRLSPTLSLDDLLLLLEHEPTVHALIQRICAAPDAAASPAQEADAVLDEAPEAIPDAPSDEVFDEAGQSLPEPAPIAHTPHAPKAFHTAPDRLYQQLTPWLGLLDDLRSDPELAALLLGRSAQASEAAQLLTLAACAAQWDITERLWELLAQRCKQGKRPATASEQAALEHAVQLHNLRWQDRQACLSHISPGAEADYEQHQIASGQSGARVQAQWLPGLQDASGKLRKKPLVSTT